jgi:IS4 transposase
VGSNTVHGKVYSIQHYVIKFVSDLRQVVGFLRVFRFPPPIKLTATIYDHDHNDPGKFDMDRYKYMLVVFKIMT